MTREPFVDWAAARSEKWRRQLAGLEAMLEPLNTPLIEALDLTAPVRVADVGCGAGATTIEVLRRAPAGSVAHGFDVSPALIEVARRRSRERNRPLAFEIADMEHAAPPNLPYDRLISRLGVMFFQDGPAAFANLRRWLVTGGRFAFAVWGPLDANVWMTATRAAVSEVVRLPPSNATAPGPFRYSDAAVLRSLLTRAGFDEVTVADWNGPLPIGGRLGARKAAHFALASFSSFSELLTGAGGRAFSRAHSSLTSRFLPYEREGVVQMNALVHIVTGSVGGN